MTTIEMRVAMAKLDGLKIVEFPSGMWELTFQETRCVLNPKAGEKSIEAALEVVHVPDYPHDLDAVARVESRLEADERDRYLHVLCELRNTAYEKPETWVVFATARERCEAVLKSTGNWKDGRMPDTIWQAIKNIFT